MSYNAYKSSAASYGSSGYSRGRGYTPRGSYRGRGMDSSSSYSSSSRGRGYSGPSRGRYNWPKEYSSEGYDSRSRYATGSSSVERYSSRGRGEDSGYRYYSRADTSEYSSPRDHRDPRSPDSPRKRMRTEPSYVQASSSRRSHEGGYGAATDYSSRYSYSEDKGSYGEDRSRGYRDERRPTSSYRSREEYFPRKAEVIEASMPPPTSIPPRYVSSTPRGSYRGRFSTRGFRGMSRMMITKRPTTLLARKRSLAESYAVRKRILTARTQAEALRKMKMIKLRRLREAAAAKKEDSSKETEDVSDEEDEEKVEEEEEGELEEGETPDKKVLKKTKVKKITKDKELEEGEEEDDGEEEEDGKKADTKPNGNVRVTINNARAVNKEQPLRQTFTGKPFIKLSCPHCLMECVTFRGYSMHLRSSQHIYAMRKQSLKHRQRLADMRMSQRQNQRLLEEKEEARGTLLAQTKFCHICKLNYRQMKSKHMASEFHQEMEKFLMPVCYVCGIEFKSPMLYENHLCSLSHIKVKAAKAERQKRLAERMKEEEKTPADEDDKDLNLDNFMILDSVGDVDDTIEEEEEEEEEDDDDEVEGEETSEKAKKEDKKKKKKSEILGIEHVKTVQVYYCDLCSQYLPRSASINKERAFATHCRTRAHIQRYIRHRDDELLRKEAERIHRKRLMKRTTVKNPVTKNASSEKNDKKMDEDKDESMDKSNTKMSEDSAGESPKKKKKKDASSKASQGGDQSSETAGESRDDLEQELEAGMDDKLWADVDKDLGELLREVEPGNKSSDEDDDSHAGGRYDRFRYSEKVNAAAEGDSAKTGDENATEADPEDDKDEKKPSKSEGGDEVPVKKAAVPTSSTPIAAVN